MFKQLEDFLGKFIKGGGIAARDLLIAFMGGLMAEKALGHGQGESEHHAGDKKGFINWIGQALATQYRTHFLGLRPDDELAFMLAMSALSAVRRAQIEGLLAVMSPQQVSALKKAVVTLRVPEERVKMLELLADMAEDAKQFMLNLGAIKADDKTLIALIKKHLGSDPAMILRKIVAAVAAGTNNVNDTATALKAWAKRP